MSDILAFLQQRSSTGKLQLPAPSAAELEQIFQAAMRAPDHGKLQPWRFLVIETEGRTALGRLFAEAIQQKQPTLSAEKREDISQKPLRAPLIITVIAVTQAHPKVPETEQLLAAGCAAYNVLLAADALGYGGIWRTGPMAEDSHVRQGLGLKANESIVGFLYLGSRQADKKSQPLASAEGFVERWPAI